MIEAADKRIRARISEWAALWGMPELDEMVKVTINPRLRSSLGRCRPSVGRVSLNAALLEGTPDRLDEVLCHEVAHVAVHMMWGRAVSPHGVEWASLIRDAGHPATIRAHSSGITDSKARRRTKVLYEHRCPVCQTVRYGRTAVARWKCAECLDAKLDGDLMITRHDATHDLKA